MTPQAGAREGLRARAHAPWGLQTTAPALLGTPRRPCVLRSRRRRSRATRAHGRPGLAVMASLCCLALSSSVCFLRSSLISCSRNAGVSGSDPAAAGAPSCAVLFASCGSSPATKRHAEHRNPCPPRQHVVPVCALDTGRPLALPPCTRGHGGTGGCSCASARGDERGRGTPPRTGRPAGPAAPALSGATRRPIAARGRPTSQHSLLGAFALGILGVLVLAARAPPPPLAVGRALALLVPRHAPLGGSASRPRPPVFQTRFLPRVLFVDGTTNASPR